VFLYVPSLGPFTTGGDLFSGMVCVRVALDRHMAGAMAVTIDLTFFMATKQTGWWFGTWLL